MFVCYNTGEIVVVIARGIGLLVAIVSIFLLILIMMFGRGVIAYALHMWGVSGVMALLAIASVCSLRYRNVSPKVLWTMISRSCC